MESISVLLKRLKIRALAPKSLHFASVPDCALMQDLTCSVGYFNSEFHREPGSKWLPFASIPDCALMQDIPRLHS
jgi:hypothetical protein